MTPEELRKVREQLGQLLQRHALDPKFGRSRGKKKRSLGRVNLDLFIAWAKETGEWPEGGECV